MVHNKKEWLIIILIVLVFLFITMSRIGTDLLLAIVLVLVSGIMMMIALFIPDVVSAVIDWLFGLFSRIQ